MPRIFRVGVICTLFIKLEFIFNEWLHVMVNRVGTIFPALSHTSGVQGEARCRSEPPDPAFAKTSELGAVNAVLSGPSLS